MAWLASFCLSILIAVPCFAETLPRPKFESVKVKISNHILNLEHAKSDRQRSYGLMLITEMPEGVDGMLFEFKKEQILNFWMKNTYIDLSIAFVNSRLKIVDIQQMKATSLMSNSDNLKVYSSKRPAQFAIEMPMGWFQKNSISAGTKVQILP